MQHSRHRPGRHDFNTSPVFRLSQNDLWLAFQILARLAIPGMPALEFQARAHSVFHHFARAGEHISPVAGAMRKQHLRQARAAMESMTVDSFDAAGDDDADEFLAAHKRLLLNVFHRLWKNDNPQCAAILKHSPLYRLDSLGQRNHPSASQWALELGGGNAGQGTASRKHIGHRVQQGTKSRRGKVVEFDAFGKTDATQPHAVRESPRA